MKWRFGGLVLIVVLGAMGASLFIGLQQSVWFDEAYSIILAKQSVAQLIHTTSLDTHPPLYYLLLKAWAGVFGWSELALRSLSVLMMGGAIAGAVLLLRRHAGQRAAVIGLLLMAVSPFLLRYGFEIRMYSMALFIGVLATLTLLRALEARAGVRWWWYGLYAVLVAIGVYTLYYLALLWLAHLAWLAWQSWRGRPSLRALVRQPWVSAYVGSVVLFLPWLPVFVHQLGNGALTPVAQQLTAANMVGLVSFWFMYTPAFGLNGVTSLVVLGVVITLAVTLSHGLRAASAPQRRLMLLWVAYVTVPIALIALVSLVKPMYIERYLLHVMIAVLLLIGVALAILMRKGWRPARWVFAGLMIVSLYGVTQLMSAGNYNYQRIERPAGKKTAALLRPACPDETIIFNGPYLAIDESYYFEGCPTYVLSAQELPTYGGFSLLHGTPRRLTSIQAMDGHDVAKYVHYNDDYAQPTNPRYTLRDSVSVGKVIIDTYVKIAS